MKRLRTNIRKVFILALIIFARPDIYSLIIGSGLVILGQLLHFVSAGYLVKKDELITAGPYRFLRNPFYFSNFLSDLGLCIIASNQYIPIIYLGIFYLIVIPLRIRKEEKFLMDRFGSEFLNYCHKVPSFFPRLHPPKLETHTGRFAWSQIVKHQEIWRVMRAFGLVIVFYLQFRVNYNIFDLKIQWPDIFSTPLNLTVLILLGLIIMVPPVVQYLIEHHRR